jgi:ceramide glucosyltransferase
VIPFFLSHLLPERALLGMGSAGVAYHFVSLEAIRRFARSRPPETRDFPPISILKPVRGVDPDAYENYASFCRQDYPEYEVVFGIQDPDDPAIALIRRLQEEFPEVRVRLVVSDFEIGANRKVCNLHNLLQEAEHELLVISDSDMRVRPEYLREIAAYFEDPEVGLVTSPYCGVGARSLPAGLEALGMATDFFPGVAVATQLAPFGFGLGSTLAMKRGTLEEIGGFAGVADYLADDFQLGRRVAEGGHRVALSRYVVDTVLPNAGFWLMMARRLRWMRTARTCQPAGFAGSLITHSTVWALALALLSGFRPWALEALALQQAVRGLVAAYTTLFVLRQRSLVRWLPLLPVSDLLNFSLWVGSWCGSTVYWRGNRYRLTTGGRMDRIAAEPRRRAPGEGVSVSERVVTPQTNAKIAP